MVNINEKQMQQKLDYQYHKGIQQGIKIMEQRILLACQNGNPINIQGKAVFIYSDLQNLRNIFDDLEADI